MKKKLISILFSFLLLIAIVKASTLDINSNCYKKSECKYLAEKLLEKTKYYEKQIKELKQMLYRLEIQYKKNKDLITIASKIQEAEGWNNAFKEDIIIAVNSYNQNELEDIFNEIGDIQLLITETQQLVKKKIKK